MIDKILFGLEKWHYISYARLNQARKAKDASNVIFKFFDDLRRQSGFVRFK